MTSPIPLWWPNKQPIYNPEKSYLDNAENGPFFDGEIPERTLPKKEDWIDFLGFKIASPIGIPAGPLLNARWISFASQLGFDILCYKTIRSKPFAGHQLPNVRPVSIKNQLIPSKLPSHLTIAEQFPHNVEQLAITNSFGNPSRDDDYLSIDIAKANASLQPGQVMIVSIFGSESSERSLIDDFCLCADKAKGYGAKIVEANFSCPNVNKKEGSLYQDPDKVFSITKRLVAILGETPLILKIGLIENPKILREVLIQAAKAGAQAVCGINTISLKVLDQHGMPALGLQRPVSGICGSPIRDAACLFLKEARKTIHQEQLNLTLMGTGGVVLKEHFDELFSAGAEIAMTATGMMWDPFIALRYYYDKKESDLTACRN